MEKLSLKKKLFVIRLYFEGLSYDEIAAKAGVGKGTVTNVITELKAGRFPEFGDLSEQIDSFRELAIDLKRTRLTPVQSAVGVSVLSRLQQLGVEPGEIEDLSALCRTLNADGVDIPLFVRAALAFEEKRRRTGLSVDELETKVESLEDTATRLEPLAKEVIKQETQLVELTKQRESLAEEVSVLEKQSNVLQEKVRDREKRETELSNRIRDLEDRVQSADERLKAARKDLNMLSGIGMSLDNLTAFTQRTKVIAQRHGIKPEVLNNKLMEELEQLDEGLKLDTVTKAKKEELRMEQRKLLKAKEEQAAISSTNENLREERAILRAALLEEKRYIVTEIKSINTAVKSTITKLKQNLAAGVRDSVLEVNKLKNQSLRLGKELGQYHEMVESNKWLKSLQSLAEGDEEVEPGQVRVIGSTVLHAMITWLDHYSQDNGASWLLRSYIASLIGELERWKI